MTRQKHPRAAQLEQLCGLVTMLTRDIDAADEATTFQRAYWEQTSRSVINHELKMLEVETARHDQEAE